MTKLILLCVTVLLCVTIVEYASLARLQLQLEYNLHLQSMREWNAQHQRPSIQISPAEEGAQKL